MPHHHSLRTAAVSVAQRGELRRRADRHVRTQGLLTDDHVPEVGHERVGVMLALLPKPAAHVPLTTPVPATVAGHTALPTVPAGQVISVNGGLYS